MCLWMLHCCVFPKPLVLLSSRSRRELNLLLGTHLLFSSHLLFSPVCILHAHLAHHSLFLYLITARGPVPPFQTIPRMSSRPLRHQALGKTYPLVFSKSLLEDDCEPFGRDSSRGDFDLGHMVHPS